VDGGAGRPCVLSPPELLVGTRAESAMISESEPEGGAHAIIAAEGDGWRLCQNSGDLLISCEALEREARPLLQGRTGTWFCSEHRPADEAGSEPLVRERR